MSRIKIYQKIVNNQVFKYEIYTVENFVNMKEYLFCDKGYLLFQHFTRNSQLTF